MKYKNLIENTAVGILIGWSSALTFVLMAALSSDVFWSVYGTTVITTFATIIAAGLAGAAVMSQIEAQQAAETDRSRRRFEAAKAALPLVLADWAHSIEHTTTLLLRTAVTSDTRQAPPEIPAPQLPEDTIQVLAECIEAADAQDATRLANLLRHQQVLSSRLRPHRAMGPGRSITDLIVTCLVVDALLDDCILYAQGLAKHIPERLEKVHFLRKARRLHPPSEYDESLTDALTRAEERKNLELFSQIED